MSPLFLRTTKSLVRELGRKGELVPVDSLNSSPRLRPFCLLRKKHKHYLWPWDTPFIPTNFSLLDMLEPGCPDPELKHGSPINIWEKVSGGLTGAVSLSAGLQGQVTGSSKATCVSALTVQTLWIPPCTWEMLLEKRKLRLPRPSFLQELQSRKERESLYVVTEAVETLQEAVLQSQGQMLGAGQLSLLQLGRVQVQVQSHMDAEKAVSIPQGSVLAYRVLKLVVEEDGWGSFVFSLPALPHAVVLHFPERKLYGDTRRGLDLSLDSGEEPTFQSLRDQVDDQLQDLTTLSSELRDTFLSALQKLLQDRQALQELEDTVIGILARLGKGPRSRQTDKEGTREGTEHAGTGPGHWVAGLAQMEGPGGFILSIIQDSTGNLLWSRGRAILYILGALAALSEPQHCLLAQSIERRILPEELGLVSRILEYNCGQTEETAYPLPTEVLCALESEDVVLILSLVQSCGLELDQPSCHFTWDPTVMPQLSALYGCLTGLQLLAVPNPRLSSEEGILTCP